MLNLCDTDMIEVEEKICYKSTGKRFSGRAVLIGRKVRAKTALHSSFLNRFNQSRWCHTSEVHRIAGGLLSRSYEVAMAQRDTSTFASPRIEPASVTLS